MSKRSGLPSRRSSEKSAQTSAATRPRTRGAGESAPAVDVRGWLGGVRLSAFMLIMLGLVVFGVLVLVPTISTYVSQQQRIAALTHEVAEAQARVDDLKDQRDKWSDSSYVMTQARERLYYYKPGELSYIVVDDLPASAHPAEQPKVSTDVTETSSDWMNQLLRSVTEAGMSTMVTDANPDAEPTPDPAATPSG